MLQPSFQEYQSSKYVILITVNVQIIIFLFNNGVQMYCLVDFQCIEQ